MSDTELLEFIEREQAHVFYRGSPGWTVQCNWGTGHLIQPTRPVLREAINAAMEEKRTWRRNERAQEALVK